MCELKSYWYVHGGTVNYPSLAAAKHAVRTAFAEGESEILLEHPFIYHDVNGLTVSQVYFYRDAKEALNFSRPRKL